jgi:hypothetical protein
MKRYPTRRTPWSVPAVKNRCASWPQSKTPMRSVGSWNIWASGWPTPDRFPEPIRPLGSDRYPRIPTRIPAHSFRPLRKKTTPSSRQPTGTVEPPRQAYGLPLVVPVCSISGRPTWFSCLFDLTLSRAAHPGAALPSDSPGSHNILYVFFLTRNYATCYSLFVRKQFRIFRRVRCPD